MPIGKTDKLLLNESNQHRILSTGGAGSLEEQRAVYWMHARWGKEMPVKWEGTKVLQRFAFGIQTYSSSMRYYRVKPERQSIAWVCCTSGNVWYNVVMLSSVVQCRLVSRVLNCCPMVNVDCGVSNVSNETFSRSCPLTQTLSHFLLAIGSRLTIIYRPHNYLSMSNTIHDLVN